MFTFKVSLSSAISPPSSLHSSTPWFKFSADGFSGLVYQNLNQEL